ncbi:MAG: hypothetical protein MUP66_02255 [Candidatus Nanohaloarchaeota archaeon QJJ-5]|nr:hypothetical protein [Candidatus Nanohaloarchaeota archaeon QJJ-5]
MSMSVSANKGQASFEFMIVIIFLSILFAATIPTLGDRQVALTEREVSQQGKAIADTIAYEFDLAMAQGDGYYRNFELPAEIAYSDYNVTVDNGTVLVEWAQTQRFTGTAASDVDGEIEPGVNAIENQDGTIVVVEE